MINLVFDYDGTLHDCIKIYAPAFREAYRFLADRGYAEEREWSDREITKWLGVSSKDMWDSFMPGLSEDLKRRSAGIIGGLMERFVRDERARLYPGSAEILRDLKAKGYRLVFLSNCETGYMDAHIKAFGLDEYFSDFFCAESYGYRSKKEILGLIRERYSGEFIVIGDRFHDMEAASAYGLFSIGCAYGYGAKEELLSADFIAESVREIPSLVAALSN